MITITREMLSKVFDSLLLKLEQDDVNEVVLQNDYYRLIPTDEWTNFENQVEVVGSLVDDFDSLNLVINDSERLPTYVDFDRTASILRAISETLNPVNAKE